MPKTIHFHHGTDQASANDLSQNGVSQKHAAAWNGSGEFWATTDHDRAHWFALSNSNSPPAACFEFEMLEEDLLLLLQMVPVTVICHGTTDYEFLPASHAVLNQKMLKRQIVNVA